MKSPSYLWILLLIVTFSRDVKSSRELRKLTSQFNRWRQSVARELDDLKWESSRELRKLTSQFNRWRQSVARELADLKWEVGDLQAQLELARRNDTADSSAVGVELTDISDNPSDTRDIRLKYAELKKQVDDLKEENANLKEVVEHHNTNLSKALTAITLLEESTEKLKDANELNVLKGQLESDTRKLENELHESVHDAIAVLTRAFGDEKKQLREFQTDVANKTVGQEQGCSESEVKQIINDSIVATEHAIKETCEQAVDELAVKVERDMGNLSAALETVSNIQEKQTQQLGNLTECCSSKPGVLHVIGTGSNVASAIPGAIAGPPLAPRLKDANYSVYAVYDADLAKQIRVGSRVIRGKHWSWGDQNGGGPGTMFEWYHKDPGTKQVMVRWDAGRQANYRLGQLGLYDLYIITGGDADHLADTPTLRFKPIFKKDLEAAITIGSRVIRGEDWSWRSQDGGGPGTVTSWYQNSKATRQVMVDWDNAGRANYRVGAHGQYDLFLLAE